MPFSVAIDMGRFDVFRDAENTLEFSSGKPESVVSIRPFLRGHCQGAVCNVS